MRKRKTNEKVQSIFLDKVKQYNKSKRYYTHFIDLGDGSLMIIDWNGSWKYKIVELEKLKRGEKNV